MLKGDFTIPGESGYEDLTLRLAEKWGAESLQNRNGRIPHIPAILHQTLTGRQLICAGVTGHTQCY